jgi:hypothetical protein
LASVFYLGAEPWRRKDGEHAVNVQVQPGAIAAERHLPFERVALVLQGGGALGAYQAGVYEALAEAAIHPNWIAGVSIGAINAALIAGNPPQVRVDRLREFWTQVTSGGGWPCFSDPSFGLARGDIGRNFLNQMSAGLALANGASGFFRTRPVGPWFQTAGTIEATSFYDTADLKRTLERLVDFDRVNAGGARLSVGAVSVRTGNFVCFGTATHTICPDLENIGRVEPFVGRQQRLQRLLAIKPTRSPVRFDLSDRATSVVGPSLQAAFFGPTVANGALRTLLDLQLAPAQSRLTHLRHWPSIFL